MTNQAISTLRRRMIEDMAIRKLAPKTQHDYVQRVKNFAAFLGRSPDTAKSEEVRRFRLHLASSGAGTPKINATVSALRFFFNVTLDRPDLAKHLSFMREPRKVPVVCHRLLVHHSRSAQHQSPLLCGHCLDKRQPRRHH
jgi:integrase/recombinase XerD